MNATGHLVFREAASGEIDQVLAFRNRIFSPITRAAWEREQPITAAVALEGEDVAGAIPLALRSLRIGPGRELSTAFENAVGTEARRRGQGVGKGMIGACCEFMKGRVDALCLYRGDERSEGYRFYAKTEHVDLAYARNFLLRRPEIANTVGAEWRTGVDGVVASEGEMLPLFLRSYARHGGFRERTPGFYRRALNGLIYESRPHEFVLFRRAGPAPTSAYVLAGIRVGGGDGAVRVLEMGGESEDAGVLLSAAATFAARRGLGLACVTSDESPYAPLLIARGFEPEPRQLVMLGRLLDPGVTAARVWRRVSELAGVRVMAWTPEGEWILQEPESGRAARKIRLEMKRATLTRLLFARERVSAVIATGRITVTGMRTGDAEALDECLPFAPWCYHALDYI